MRSVIFALCIAHNIIYASGSVYFGHFQDMLSSQTSYNSTLQKDKETIEKIRYKGEIHLSEGGKISNFKLIIKEDYDDAR